MRPWPPRRGSHVPTSHTHVAHTHISHTHTYTFHTHTRLFSHTTSQSLECPIPQVVVGDGGGFTKRERQAARLHRVSLQRDSVRHNSNCRSPRPRPGRDRRACARRAYGGVGPAPPVGGSLPPFLSPHAFVCLFSWPTHRSSAFQWGRFRFHPSTYPEPYRHGISLRENTESIRVL